MAGRFGRVEIRYNKLPAIAAAIRPLLVACVKKAAFDIEAEAKTRVPVDTGATKNSIQAAPEGDDLHYQIAPGTEYSIYLEYGTYKMAARPYMQPAADHVGPAFTAAIEAALRDASSP